ncbi:unnamed protein product [Pedinophyceae sp. YPF-701]|nr:unnamed protein product [Pedinophyceae sp. YPF-701]
MPRTKRPERPAQESPKRKREGPLAEANEGLREIDRQLGELSRDLRYIAATHGAVKAIGLEEHDKNASAKVARDRWDRRLPGVVLHKRSLVGHAHPVVSVCYMMRRNSVITSDNHTLRMWNHSTGKQTNCIVLPRFTTTEHLVYDSVLDVVLGVRDRHSIVAFAGSLLYQVYQSEPEDSALLCAALSRRQRLFITGGPHATLALWELLHTDRTGQAQEDASAVPSDPRGGTRIKLKCRLRSERAQQGEWVSALHVPGWEDTQEWVFAAVAESVQVWDLTMGLMVMRLDSLHDLPIGALSWQPHRRILLTGSKDQLMRVWDVKRSLLQTDHVRADGEHRVQAMLTETVNAHIGPVCGLHWDLLSNMILTLSHDGTLRVLDGHNFEQQDFLQVVQDSEGRPSDCGIGYDSEQSDLRLGSLTMLDRPIEGQRFAFAVGTTVLVCELQPHKTLLAVAPANIACLCPPVQVGVHMGRGGSQKALQPPDASRAEGDEDDVDPADESAAYKFAPGDPIMKDEVAVLTDDNRILLIAPSIGSVTREFKPMSARLSLDRLEQEPLVGTDTSFWKRALMLSHGRVTAAAQVPGLSEVVLGWSDGGLEMHNLATGAMTDLAIRKGEFSVLHPVQRRSAITCIRVCRPKSLQRQQGFTAVYKKAIEALRDQEREGRRVRVFSDMADVSLSELYRRMGVLRYVSRWRRKAARPLVIAANSNGLLLLSSATKPVLETSASSSAGRQGKVLVVQAHRRAIVGVETQDDVSQFVSAAEDGEVKVWGISRLFGATLRDAQARGHVGVVVPLMRADLQTEVTAVGLLRGIASVPMGDGSLEHHSRETIGHAKKFSRKWVNLALAKRDSKRREEKSTDVLVVGSADGNVWLIEIPTVPATQLQLPEASEDSLGQVPSTGMVPVPRGSPSTVGAALTAAAMVASVEGANLQLAQRSSLDWLHVDDLAPLPHLTCVAQSNDGTRHKGPVSSLSVVGKDLVTCDLAGQVIVWDTVTWRPVVSIKYRGAVWQVALLGRGLSYITAHGTCVGKVEHRNLMHSQKKQKIVANTVDRMQVLLRSGTDRASSIPGMAAVSKKRLVGSRQSSSVSLAKLPDVDEASPTRQEREDVVPEPAEPMFHPLRSKVQFLQPGSKIARDLEYQVSIIREGKQDTESDYQKLLMDIQALALQEPDSVKQMRLRRELQQQFAAGREVSATQAAALGSRGLGVTRGPRRKASPAQDAAAGALETMNSRLKEMQAATPTGRGGPMPGTAPAGLPQRGSYKGVFERRLGRKHAPQKSEDAHGFGDNPLVRVASRTSSQLGLGRQEGSVGPHAEGSAAAEEGNGAAGDGSAPPTAPPAHRTISVGVEPQREGSLIMTAPAAHRDSELGQERAGSALPAPRVLADGAQVFAVPQVDTAKHVDRLPSRGESAGGDSLRLPPLNGRPGSTRLSTAASATQVSRAGRPARLRTTAARPPDDMEGVSLKTHVLAHEDDYKQAMMKSLMVPTDARPLLAGKWSASDMDTIGTGAQNWTDIINATMGVDVGLAVRAGKGRRAKGILDDAGKKKKGKKKKGKKKKKGAPKQTEAEAEAEARRLHAEAELAKAKAVEAAIALSSPPPRSPLKKQSTHLQLLHKEVSVRAMPLSAIQEGKPEPELMDRQSATEADYTAMLAAYRRNREALAAGPSVRGGSPLGTVSEALTPSPTKVSREPVRRPAGQGLGPEGSGTHVSFAQRGAVGVKGPPQEQGPLHISRVAHIARQAEAGPPVTEEYSGEAHNAAVAAEKERVRQERLRRKAARRKHKQAARARKEAARKEKQEEQMARLQYILNCRELPKTKELAFLAGI